MNRRLLPLGGALALLALGHVPLASRAVAQEIDLEEFVRTQYHHGLPVEQARRFGPGAVPVLIEMLSDDREREAWPNIVQMLGLLEDPAATGPLINFLERRFTGDVDQTTYRALVLVPRSLGMIAGRSDDQARSYLLKGLTREAWQERRLAWSHPTLAPDDRATLMLKLAAEGVGMIGTPDSLKALEDLRDRLHAAPDRVRQGVLPGVQEAILVNRIIQRDGRDVLYDDRLPLRVEEERQKMRP